MSLFLDAAWGKDTPRAPIWIMRQAGRYLPEYMAIKAKSSFWEMCRTPELATEITLQPVRRLGVDAAILFSDIMTPLPPMGVDIEFAPGPVIDTPIRSMKQVEALRIPEQEAIAPYVAEAIALVRPASPVPLIGFGGAPLTLATYLVEGGGSKDYEHFRQFLWSEPQTAHALLEKLSEVSIRYLRMQIEAGAQAVQLFDSWAGLHSAAAYAEFGFPYAQKVLQALEAMGVPRIYIAVNAYHLYPHIAALPAEVISIDWRVPLQQVRPLLSGKTLQGNLDPAALLAPPAVLKEQATAVLRSGLGGAHIFNLGHGIMRQSDPDQVAYLVDYVQSFERHSEENRVGEMA